MQNNDYLINYYNEYDEEGRLANSRVGRVEYLTTIKHIDELLRPDSRIAEIGAGTGRYAELRLICDLPEEETYPEDDEKKDAYYRAANVDFVITHCAPQSIAEKFYHYPMKSDKLTSYFDELLGKINFRYWFFGHYHEDRKINDKFILLYDQIIRIL